MTTSPAPSGVDPVLMYFIAVSDQDRNCAWYQGMFGARVIRDRDPVLLELYGSTLICNEADGPTDDQPGVFIETPDPHRSNAFLNIRVGDIASFHEETAGAAPSG